MEKYEEVWNQLKRYVHMELLDVLHHKKAEEIRIYQKLSSKLHELEFEQEESGCPTCNLIATGGMFLEATCTKHGRKC